MLHEIFCCALCVIWCVVDVAISSHLSHTHHHFKPSNSIFHTLYQGTTGRQPEQCQFFGCKVKIHFYEKQPFNKKKWGGGRAWYFIRGKPMIYGQCGVCVSMYDKAGLAGQRTITTTTTINIVSVGVNACYSRTRTPSGPRHATTTVQALTQEATHWVDVWVDQVACMSQ